MNITFGQWDASTQSNLQQSYKYLKNYLDDNPTDILLLPELPFDTWITSLTSVEDDLWRQSVDYHNSWIEQLKQFDIPVIAGSRPIITTNGSKRNVGWVLSDQQLKDVHQKYYLPDEKGFWENSWYDRGNGEFDIITVDGIKIGFLICTEMWFMDHARDYAEEGIHLLLVPRSTPTETTDKWVTGGRTAAVISGAFCISSNHEGTAADNKTQLGGVGWLSGPEADLLATSSSDKKWITVNIDFSIAEEAKGTYPRYVKR